MRRITQVTEQEPTLTITVCATLQLKFSCSLLVCQISLIYVPACLLLGGRGLEPSPCWWSAELLHKGRIGELIKPRGRVSSTDPCS